MKQKLTFLSILLAITVLFTNCEEEDTVKVDFEIIVSGESPNAIVQLTNTSDEADLFKWEFSEGADIETSEEANPQITVDKTGAFTITLTATTGSSEHTKTKKVNITGVNGIYSYDDVIIGEQNHQEEYGFLLACQTGLVFKEEGLRSSQGGTIDMHIRYNIDYDVKIYSPAELGIFIIPNARATYFNLNDNNNITVTDFDNIQVDQFNSDLEYPEDYRLLIEFNELPKVIPFKDEDGKYGLVKIQEIFPEHLIMDVKVQKYLTSE